MNQNLMTYFLKIKISLYQVHFSWLCEGPLLVVVSESLDIAPYLIFFYSAL